MGPICWEHHLQKRGYGSDHPATEDMDRLGREGWELVTVTRDEQSNHTSHEFVFKRPYKLCPDCGGKVVFTYASGGGFEYLSRHIDPQTSRYCEQDIR